MSTERKTRHWMTALAKIIHHANPPLSVDQIVEKIKFLVPDTAEELDEELDSIPDDEVPVLSEDRINAIVKFATDPEFRAIAEENYALKREARLRGDR